MLTQHGADLTWTSPVCFVTFLLIFPLETLTPLQRTCTRTALTSKRQ